MTQLFSGVGTAVATPMFTDGSIDYHNFDRLIQSQLDNGIQGLVIAGTTGEGATLSLEEKINLLKRAIQLRGNQACSLILGTGSNNTAVAIEHTRAAKEAGADAALIVTPYYNKTSQHGLIAHYYAIADAVDLPIIVYNVPGRTGMTVLPETLGKLAKHPNIVGFKDATGDMEYMSKIKNVLLDNPEFRLYSGDDESFLGYLVFGGHGIISVTSNVLPKSVAHIYTLYKQGKLDEAREFQLRLCPFMNTFFEDVSPAPMKALLYHLGYSQDVLRLPLVPTTDFYRQLIIQQYEERVAMEESL
ncbi:4-hydroxy-tetrahydrodipicolinate synthase [Carnobacteriaceae bacterium zg-ZUI252]|nr:4-hydroxy-tetrahydrodipicolinate synthase [Carnobacteriaceae bacterium zg-ZUI252]MBS4770247.1 4-hydroxy-tetrahydrodipicolinate synthase [Carnobacteriaceae bacterium zg-ZUI240]